MTPEEILQAIVGQSQDVTRLVYRGQADARPVQFSGATSDRLKYVVSTEIDKGAIDRLHFFITYGTKHLEGLKVFRETEYRARRLHERNRANAKERKRRERTGMDDLFSDHQAAVKESMINAIVEEKCALAATDLMETLSRRDTVRFYSVVGEFLERHMLRETNIKDIFVALAMAGQIEDTWGERSQKPSKETIVNLK